MEEVQKSFIMDICNSLRLQMSAGVWKDFDSTANSEKVSFLLNRTKVLESIENEIEKKCQREGQVTSGTPVEEIRVILEGWDFRKNKSKALLFKEVGNEAFGEGDNEKALELYSYAIAFMQPEERIDLSILYANRSAALFHLGHFSLGQSDIDSAFDLKYPPELHFKLYERSGRCFAKLGKNPQASRRFQQAINSLSNPLVNLDEERKKNIQNTLQKLLKTSSGTGFAFICESDVAKECAPVLPTTIGGKGKYLRNASTKLSLMRNKEEGRYVVATENIGPGEIIVVEKAYVSVLTPEAYHYQCFQCFAKLVAPIPCSHCALVSFCSITCLNLAWTTHHQYECDILGIVRLAGISITCLMALRALTQSTYPEIMKWKCDDPDNDNDEEESLGEKGKKSGNWKDFQFQFKDEYKADHISSLLKLVTHSGSRSSEDYFHRIVMALFLYTLLRRTTYFGKSGDKEVGKKLDNEDGLVAENTSNGLCSVEFGENEIPSESIIQVGSILVRMLQTLQFNAHEIAGWDSAISKSCFIGGGLFPTLAFFNHSCNPAIVRYFINDTVVVRTVRTIQRGEPVTENYGPIFTQSGRTERQEYLKSRYWFVCHCVACLDDWPLFSNLSRENLSFRCRNCRSFLCKNTTESFNLLLRCARCLKPTNMLQSLKSLEKSEGKFNQAMEFLAKGKNETALGILLENLSLFDSILLPPFPDYHWCQEGLRKCYLPMGNQSNSLKLKSNSTATQANGTIVNSD